MMSSQNTSRKAAMYNATVYRIQADGSVYSTFVAEVNADGKMLRSNAAQCTGREGSEAYDEYLRNGMCAGYELRIAMDNGEGYRQAIRGLIAPPAYSA